MKKIFNRKNTIAIIIAALVITLIPVVVGAWYILSRNAGVNIFGAKISQWDLIVSDTPGGEQLKDGEVVDIKVSEFTNVTSGVMAPGTYGTIDLYIRTTSDTVSEFAIYIDESQLRLGDDYEIIQKHFKFYADETLTKEISVDTPLVGSISPNKEVKATIYWYWVYDGSDDIPANLTSQAEIDKFLREWDLEDCFISENQDKLGGNLQVYVSAYQQEPKR
jgi:hypothetical protein